MEQIEHLRLLLEQNFAPLIREPGYQQAFDYALKTLPLLERFEGISEKETLYIFLHILILQGFEKIEKISRLLQE